MRNGLRCGRRCLRCHPAGLWERLLLRDRAASLSHALDPGRGTLTIPVHTICRPLKVSPELCLQATRCSSVDVAGYSPALPRRCGRRCSSSQRCQRRHWYCGHDYSLENYEFAVTVEPHNGEVKARLEQIRSLVESGEPTVPSTIGQELATNPFLRASSPAMRRALGLPAATDVEAFTVLRRIKDRF